MRAFTVVSCLSLLFVAVWTLPGGERASLQPQNGLQSQPRCLMQLSASRTAELRHRRTPKRPDPRIPQWLDPNLDFGDTFTSPAIELPPTVHGKSKKSTRGRGKRTLQELNKFAKEPEAKILFNSVPSPMSEAGSEQLGRLAMTADEEALFNYMPRPGRPVAPFAERLVEAGSMPTRLGDEEALFNQVPSPAAPFAEPFDGASSMPNRPFADEASFFNPVPSPIAPMLGEGGEFSLADFAPASRNADYSSGLSTKIFQEEASAATDPLRLSSPMLMQERGGPHTATEMRAAPMSLPQNREQPSSVTDVTVDSAPAESQSFFLRIRLKSSQFAQSFAGLFVQLVQLPGLLLLAFAAGTSGLALLTVGKINHQAEIVSPDGIIGRLRGESGDATPRYGSARFQNPGYSHELTAPSKTLRNLKLQPGTGNGLQRLDPFSPFAEALSERQAPAGPPSLPFDSQSSIGSHGGVLAGRNSMTLTGLAQPQSVSDQTRLRALHLAQSVSVPPSLHSLHLSDVLRKVKHHGIKPAAQHPSSTLSKFLTAQIRGISTDSATALGQDTLSPHGQPLASAHYLCPGLVVPRNCECIFAVPKIGGDPGSIRDFIYDLAGKPALQLEVRTPDLVGSDGLDPNPVVRLNSCEKTDEFGRVSSKTLAYCTLERYASARRDNRDRAYIYDAAGVLFGTMMLCKGASGQCYSVCCESSIQLSLEGDFKQHLVNAWSESRHLVGDSSPSCEAAFDHTGRCRQVRVLANMDAGLLLAALVCAELMEGKQ